MDCRCNEATELYGDEADRYATEHLVAGRSDTARLEQRFSCPDTGRVWKLDYPDRTEREPGQARLRTEPA